MLTNDTFALQCLPDAPSGNVTALDPPYTEGYTFYHPGLDFPYGAVVHNRNPKPYIGSLWKQAKEEDLVLADYFRCKFCTFYLPSDLPASPDRTLLSRSREWLAHHRDDGNVVNNISLVQDCFPDGPRDRMVHILVVTEEVLESLDMVEDVYQALKRCEKLAESSTTSNLSPSQAVASVHGIQQVVVNRADLFHAGRPATNYGPPASLFNPHLGLLDYHLRHLDEEFPDPPPDLVKLVCAFMATAAESPAVEYGGIKATECSLSDIFAQPLSRDPRFKVISDAIYNCNIPCLIVQVKDEAGLEGDASLQAGLSYMHIIAGPTFKKLRWHSNCPSVLVGIMGDCLEIGAAIFTDGTYYNRLFSERLQLGFHADKNILHLARAFMATRIAISRLTRYYAQLKTSLLATPTIAHLFPSPLPLPSYQGFVPSLTFTSRLSRSGKPFLLAADEEERQAGVYLATMPRPPSTGAGDNALSVNAPTEDVEVVVKFTARYNEDAHRLLAERRLAPELHVCIPVCGDLFMVVMERVRGEMAWEAERRRELVPFSVYEDVRDAISLLHSNDLVFGDLRPANIMVIPGRSSVGERPCGMLIDFDWVATHGRGRYPATLNDGLLDWEASGIQRCEIMDKVYDLAMLERFSRKCQLT